MKHDRLDQGTTLGGTYVSVEWLKSVEAERDAAVEDLHRMHTLCMHIGHFCPACGSEVVELLEGACVFCAEDGQTCWRADPADSHRCSAFKWRGPQPRAGAADNLGSCGEKPWEAHLRRRFEMLE